MDSHTSATTPAAAPEQPQGQPGVGAAHTDGPSAGPPGAGASSAPAGANVTAATSATGEDGSDPQALAQAPQAGFGSRGRRRRRARFLRKARELAYRDLGGLVFSLHRFGQRNDALVLAKLSTLSRIDAELRALEDSLSERQPVTVLREAGITACPRCAAIHSSEDRFCPSCGLSMSRRSDLPIAGASGPATGPGTAASGAVAASPAPGAAAAPTAPDPATAQHAAVAGGQAQPHPAGTPATQAFDAITPAAPGAAGRSPLPPSSARPQEQPTASDDDQPTEIIRPPATGS
ncbi:MAG TPA: zinc ribbon domain-containing protein [Solirubrobacteraceae bacterium]|nr:zinc ribbon domain-containing protein [Solirubrobacteraceae bacterium]